MAPGPALPTVRLWELTRDHTQGLWPYPGPLLSSFTPMGSCSSCPLTRAAGLRKRGQQGVRKPRRTSLSLSSLLPFSHPLFRLRRFPLHSLCAQPCAKCPAHSDDACPQLARNHPGSRLGRKQGFSREEPSTRRRGGGTWEQAAGAAVEPHDKPDLGSV